MDDRCPGVITGTPEGDDPVYVIEWNIDPAGSVHFIVTDLGADWKVRPSKELRGPASLGLVVLRGDEVIVDQAISPEYDAIAESQGFVCYRAELSVDVKS